MRILTKEEFQLNPRHIEESIVDRGEIYIHPTDTIYGIGGNATESEVVIKIQEAKGRFDKPFSVIAPSKDWIIQNCKVSKEAEKWIDKLPGPYTLILKLKNKGAIAEEVAPGRDTVGVRIPKHWFSEVASSLGIPLITTSANRQGQDFMTSLENLDPSIKKKMNFAIYEDEKTGRPSRIINLAEAEVVITAR